MLSQRAKEIHEEIRRRIQQRLQVVPTDDEIAAAAVVIDRLIETYDLDAPTLERLQRGREGLSDLLWGRAGCGPKQGVEPTNKDTP